MNWHAGQQVAVRTGGSVFKRMKLRTVKRVLRRFIELDDGSRWSPDGYRYPRERGVYHWDTCEPATEHHRTQVARQNAVEALHGAGVQGGWEPYATAQLFEICRILDLNVNDPREEIPF